MKIVQYPHPALRWKSKPIAEINAELRRTVAEMFELMYESQGIGLAANQVALPFRLFVMDTAAEDDDRCQKLVFINPEIRSRKGSVEGEEGCLSLPELFGQVRRAEQIVVDAFDLQGREFTLPLADLPGRVVQHEHDHLDGVLFVDRMSDTSRRELQDRLGDFEARFHRQQAAGEYPSDDDIERELQALEPN